MAYRLEVSRSPDFKREGLLASPRLAATSAEQRFAQSGTYYWRVRAILPSGEVTRFSEARRFRIRLTQPKLRDGGVDYEGRNLAPPRPPQSPRISRFAALDRVLKSLFVTDAHAAESVPGGPVLAWDPVAGAARYLLEISRTPDFKQPTLRERVEAPRYQWRSYRPGRYLWRVTALDPAGVPGVTSKPAALVVKLSPPLLKKPEDVLETSADATDRRRPLPAVSLDWSGVPGAAKYEVQVAPDLAFNAPRAISTIVAFYAYLPEREGSFYVRVRAVSSDGEPLTRYSGVQSFTVARRLAPPAPPTPEMSSRASVGIGLSRRSYQDSGATAYSAWGVGIQAQARYPFKSTAFDWSARGEVALLPLGQSLAISIPSLNSDGLTPRFLSLGAAIGWNSAALAPPWRVSLRAGLFYETMFESPFVFGYQNVWGPELYPELAYSWSRGQVASVRIKLSPAFPVGGSLDFSSRQLGLGADYAWPRASGRAIRLSLDFSQLWLSPSGGPTATRQALSLGIGYGF